MLTLNLHLLFFLLSLILLLFQEDGLHVPLFALLFACIELFLWAKRERRLGTLNWCHPVPVFTLGYCIIYYQLPFCYLGDFPLSYYSNYVIFAPHNVSYCVLLGALGLSAFFSGEQFAYLKRGPSVAAEVVAADPVQVQHDSERIKSVNTLVLLATLAFFLLYLWSMGLGAYFGYSYGSKLATEGLTPHFAFAYTILLYLAILFEMARLVMLRPNSLLSYLGSWDIRVLALTLVTIVPPVLSGDRSSYLQPMALLSVPFFIFVKRLRFGSAVAAVLVLAFALVLVGDTRGGRSVGWREALEARVEAAANPAEWPTIELANSFGTFNIATHYFPNRYEYNNGLNMFYRVSSLIPFTSVFTEVDKKNKENDYIFSSGLFFTNILTQGSFSSGSGTSSLADVYMDFGPYGIPFVLFAWGMFMGWISHKMLATGTAVFVFLYAYYSYFGIYVNRSSFFFGWNNFVWVILLYYFINKLYLKRRLLR